MDFKIFLVTLVLMLVSGINANHTIPLKPEMKFHQLSDESLYMIIKLYGIKFPEIVYSQAVLESSQFNSELFVRTKNLFGMKQPNYRETTSLGKSNDGYAQYDHWMMSVRDYHFWQKNNMNESVDSRDEYFKLLSRQYAEDRKYIVKLKNIIKNNNNSFKYWNNKDFVEK